MIRIGGRSEENGLEMIDDDKIPDTYSYGMTECNDTHQLLRLNPAHARTSSC